MIDIIFCFGGTLTGHKYILACIVFSLLQVKLTLTRDDVALTKWLLATLALTSQIPQTQRKSNSFCNFLFSPDKS